MAKILAYTKEDCVDDRHQLQCAICGENDRNKLLVEELGIAISMGGYNYSFCSKCWTSRILGKKLLELLKYPTGLKIKDAHLELKEID